MRLYSLSVAGRSSKRRALNLAKHASEQGYQVRLIFVGIADAELSRRRVDGRVKAGGHAVPAEKIQQRFPRTLENLKRGIEQLPDVWVFDNSFYENPYQLLARFKDGKPAYQTANIIPTWAQPFV